MPNVVRFGDLVVPAGDVEVRSTTELRVKVPAILDPTPKGISVTVKEQKGESTGDFRLVQIMVTAINPAFIAASVLGDF